MRMCPGRRSLHLGGQRKESGEVGLVNTPCRLQAVFTDEGNPLCLGCIRELITLPGARITQTTLVEARAAPEILNVSEWAVPGGVQSNAQVRVHGCTFTFGVHHLTRLDRSTARSY